jgi:hypothetical protein
MSHLSPTKGENHTNWGSFRIIQRPDIFWNLTVELVKRKSVLDASVTFEAMGPESCMITELIGFRILSIVQSLKN